MAHPAKRKGDRAELEIAGILADQLGVNVRRKLGAGRTDDEGDLDGLADVTVEVKNYRDLGRAMADGIADLEREQSNSGTPYGVAFIRRPGGRWIAIQTVESWCAMYREVIA